jgi:hypothetical protein
MSVEGEIVSSELGVYTDIGEALQTSYKAKVKYQYSVEGEKYTSKRVFYGGYMHTNLPYGPKRTLKKYLKGDKVVVYYNPANHRQSVLETGINSIIYRELFIGILFSVLSIFMVIKESFLRSIF